MTIYKLIIIMILGSTLYSCGDIGYLPVTGEYSIGTTVIVLTDELRDESYTENKDDKRRVVVRAWYPASITESDKLAEYNGKGVAKEFQSLFKIPAFLMAKGESKAFTDAKAINKTFPVVIYNHGFTSWESQSASTMEELASNGYIVLSINHPYESLYVDFKDGTTANFSIPNYKEKLKVMNKDLDKLADNLIELITPVKLATSDMDYKQAIINLTESDVYNAVYSSFELWTADTLFLISSLDKLNSGEIHSSITSMLQVDNIALTGHSFGGFVTSEIAMMDIDQVKCGISYDGLQLFKDIDKDISLKAPVLFMSSTHTKYGKKIVDLSGINDYLSKATNESVISGYIENTGHFNYSDLGYISFLKRTSMLGPIDGVRGMEIMNGMTLSYLNHYLKGEENPDNSWKTLYPEWKISSRN